MNSITVQLQTILDHLKAGKSLNTLEARERLGIYHPAARVQSLRELGYDISNVWTTEVDVTGTKHRIAKYLLQGEGGQV